MSYNRRKFLQTSGGLALAGLAGSRLASIMGDSEKKIKPFGLQLWSIRDAMAKDPKARLSDVASYGYKQLESFEGSMGMFWGMTAKEFKDNLDGLGMKIVSSHCDINKDFEKKAADAAAIGMKYLIYPYEGPKKTLDDYKKLGDTFNQRGEICKKNGIRFAFHNHDFSFRKIDGEFPQELMIKNSDPALVDFEMDIYWVVTAGEDPISWLQKYPGRFKLCHIKDRIKDSKDSQASCVLGKGSIDFPKILKAAQKDDMKYFIVEHERYDDGTPMECAKADAEYMKVLSI